MWCVRPGASHTVIEIPSSRRRSGCAFRACVSHTGYGGTAFQAAVWCVCPGAPPPVMEIPSSRRGARVFFLGMRSAYPVTEVPSSRRRVDGVLLKMFCLKCQNWDFVLIFVA